MPVDSVENPNMMRRGAKEEVATESVNLGASKLVKYREAPPSIETTPVPQKVSNLVQASPD